QRRNESRREVAHAALVDVRQSATALAPQSRPLVALRARLLRSALRSEGGRHLTPSKGRGRCAAPGDALFVATPPSPRCARVCFAPPFVPKGEDISPLPKEGVGAQHRGMRSSLQRPPPRRAEPVRFAPPFVPK